MINLEGIHMPSTVMMPNSIETQTEQTKSGDFDSVLKAIEHTNQTQVSANQLMSDVILGKSEDTHGAMIALEKASIQMELMVKVRDQLTEGINKLINIQI